MPAKIAASIPQSITNFEYSRGLQPTQTCLGAKHEAKIALNEENESKSKKNKEK